MSEVYNLYLVISLSFVNLSANVLILKVFVVNISPFSTPMQFVDWISIQKSRWCPILCTMFHVN